MAPALSAELLELEAIRRLLLVFCRDVIPVLALGALKCNVVSWHNPSTPMSDKLEFAALLSSSVHLFFDKLEL